MTARRISPGAAAKELIRRDVGSSAPRIDIDAVCHAKQAALVRAIVERKRRYIDANCGRQSGKSHGCAGASNLVAANAAGVNTLYVTKTYASCEKMAFKPARQLNTQWKLGGVPRAGGSLDITFPNGSTSYYMGADSEGTIEKLRGTPNLALVVIDEAGLYSPDQLRSMIEAVTPGLRPLAGTLVVAGTPSRAGKQGTWYDITQNPNFDHHRFDYRDNDRVPSFAEAERLIDEELAMMFPALTPEERRKTAYFLREYLSQFVVDLEEKVYQLAEINLVDEIPADLDTYATGGDIGVKANDALVSLGWKQSAPGSLWAVDQKTESGQDSIACADMVQDHYALRKPLGVWMDPGGLGSKTILTVQRLYPKIPVFEAQKPPVGVQVRYVNDLLQGARGWRLYVLRGSRLALELAGPTWVDGLAGGAIDEHGLHSDLVPALRYVAIAALPLLQAILPPEPPKDDVERHRAQIRAELAEIAQQEARVSDNDGDPANW